MIKEQFPLGFQWPTLEPFLFCVHHHDYYPKGTKEFGPDPQFLKGRNIGEDFQEKDGFRMYHGDVVPGFPVHPHRGFETITIVRKGFIDHADSLGAAARYGDGDVQWLTAGKGIQHSEMFPLLRQEKENTVELFQIWLNLPKKNKMAEPFFSIFWSEKIPKLMLDDGRAEISIIAGAFNGIQALPPPPASWANQPGSDVAVWLIKMQKNSKISLPEAKAGTSRALYFFEGKTLKIAGQNLKAKTGAVLDSEACELQSADSEVQVLVLQAKPIGETVAQHGPFVMNTREEVMEAFRDYQETQFGGWKWTRDDMVHGNQIERFAQFPDGKRETP